MNDRATRIVRVALPLAAVQLVLAGATGPAELALSASAAVLATAYAAGVGRQARAPFHPPLRWLRAVTAALPALLVESALLARALGRQLAGGPPVAGREDEGRVVARGVDAATAAIAAAAYPCLTPNTVVRAVGHGGHVTGRRLLDAPGHALRDDLARLP